jgi:hypothetical protein
MMTDVAKRDPTIMEVAISRAGVLKGGRVCAFITQWAIASQSLGRSITREEYADWWRESERNVYRHLADFRAVFPGFDTPQPMADLAQQRAAGWQARGVGGFGQLPVSLVVA